MYEISELTFLRLTLFICAPTIVMLAFSPVAWMISSFCKAFKNDPTSPSFIVSYIWKESKWYVSIARYSDKFAGGKQTIMNSKHSWLTFAVIGLIFQWVKYWWPNVVRPKMKATKDKIASLFEKRPIIDAVSGSIIAAHEFDKLLNSLQWNATQRMFLQSVKQAVTTNGPMDSPIVFEKRPFSAIGDMLSLFSRSHRHQIYKIAGIADNEVENYEKYLTGQKNQRQMIDDIAKRQQTAMEKMILGRS